MTAVINFIYGLNDKVWQFIFLVSDVVCDNAYYAVITTSVLLAIIFSLIRRSRYVFGGMDCMFAASVYLMIERLPYIHERMKLALNTAIYIIRASDTYETAFSMVTGTEVSKASQYAECLYNEANREKLITANPTDLYEHFFKTLDEILKISGIGRIDACIPIWIFCVLLSIMIVVTLCQMRSFYQAFPLICFVMTIFLNTGTAVCIFTLWLIEEVIVGLFGEYMQKKRN